LVCQQRNNYEKVSGCSGSAEYGVDYCVKPTKNPTKSPTKNPTESPTKNPTASPTLSPTERCDANNCMNWSCLDWCECYDESAPQRRTKATKIARTTTTTRAFASTRRSMT